MVPRRATAREMSQPGQYGPFGIGGRRRPPASANGCRPPQPSSTYPPRGFALAPARCTHFATDGTPFASTAYNMYQPGGARFDSVGIVTEMPVLVGVNPDVDQPLVRVARVGRRLRAHQHRPSDRRGLRGGERAVVAVVELGRTVGHRRPRGAGLEVRRREHLDAHLERGLRVAAEGGDAPVGQQHRRRVVEPADGGDATFVHVFVFGWKICALYTGAPSNWMLLVPPPVSNTVESGSTTALTYIFATSIGGPGW